MEALQDDRARVAMYALRSILFKSIPSTDVFKILQAVPTTKVTIAKEKARLIGELKTEEAFQYLVEMAGMKLHADAQTAVFRALWHFSERAETWAIIMRAAADPDPNIAKSIVTITDINSTMMPISTRQNFLKLLLKLMNHPLAEVRVEAFNYISSTPIEDTNNVLSPRLLELVFSSLDDEVLTAATAIFYSRVQVQPGLVAEIFRKVLKKKKMLSQLFYFYTRRLIPSTQLRFLPATRLILQVLKEDRLTISLRTRLICIGLPVEEQKQALLDILPELHADALAKAISHIENSRMDMHTAWQMESLLANKPDERARRLALAFLKANTDRARVWTDEQRERLEVYRGDESLLVAEAATYMFPPSKDT